MSSKTAFSPSSSTLVYELPSGARIKVNGLVPGTLDDWNCVFRHQSQAGFQVCFSGAFIRRFAKALQGAAGAMQPGQVAYEH